jgi:hypothetical protein
MLGGAGLDRCEVGLPGQRLERRRWRYLWTTKNTIEATKRHSKRMKRRASNLASGFAMFSDEPIQG